MLGIPSPMADVLEPTAVLHMQSLSRAGGP